MSNQPAHRPIGVTILAILALIAAVVNGYHALQYMGLFPITLGPISFFNINLLGSLGYIALAAIWVWVFTKLWALNPQGWSFMVILSVINIVFAVLAIIGQSSWQSQMPAIIISALVLIYAYSSGVKKAFNVP